ncbi:transmembrane amino acid transporter family protein [Actinidia rufa]|uniref:Transmembrane amino acid transporter family protein n=1 Tax=Actinidia rufa TaxID=165716 RepID=A0A7J0GZE8_9ERIC|nr:transmembrane amino acid transporter family protein [Actinidia rufa]
MEKGPPRQAKWWYSTFHTVTAMVGAGVLSLPYAMAYLGWGPGTMVMVLLWCITLNTMWQLIQLHECVPGTRFDRYYDLGKHAFGPRLGPWIVLPQQLIVQDQAILLDLHIWVHPFLPVSAPQFRFCFWGVSVAAAVMSLSYSTIAWVGCLSRGQVDNVSYDYKQTSGADYIFRVFNALGQISIASAGHAVVMEIQATVPSTPENPSRGPMWNGVVWAYFINAICYFPVAFTGYWAFGQDVADNVLVGLERPSWLVAAAANLMVVIHVIGSYQV